MSVSASAENLSTDAQSCDGGSMCLELALEGERLCKAGDCRAGVAFFEAAIQAGTDDLRTLSAIYSQLGNAYFYLGDYNKAMQYHKHDLTLARTMNDRLGEAKASGNLGNTLKVMGKFAEAIQCCKRHLEISRALGDRLSEGRALYNLGNVYHAQGKQLGRVGQNDPGHFPQEVRDCLLQAVSYYEENLELMRSLDDRQGMGRACGNLGNTCYLLGEFSRAIRYHTERLRIAREFGDKPAERRANSNLANSHIFLGQFENAAEHYKRTLALAEELGDAAVEAQACYSLGNTYTLLREYRAAEQYHARHLAAARSLRDRVGEGRACWSLGNAHAALGNHEKALYYANEHYNISKELGDVLGMATAQMNIGDLRKVLGLPAEEARPPPAAADRPPPAAFSALRVRRQSMEQLSLIQITPDAKSKEVSEGKRDMGRGDSDDNPEESFFELLSRCQSARLDEQRATLRDKENRPEPAHKLQRSHSSGDKHNNEEITSANEEFVELLNTMQSSRIDSQRAELAPPAKKSAKAAKSAKPEKNSPAAGKSGSLTKGTPPSGRASAASSSSRGTSGASLPGTRADRTTSTMPEKDFIELLARVQDSPEDEVVERPRFHFGKLCLWFAKGSRIDDQRTELPPKRAPERAPSSTVPDAQFIDALMRMQSGRMDDQRASIPLQENRGKGAGKLSESSSKK